MRRGKSKSKYAGVRLSEEQSQVLSRLRQNSNLSKSEILVKGLELLTSYYSLGLNEPSLNLELRNLETEAIRHAEALKQIKKKGEAIEQMVQELSDVEKILGKYHGDKSYLIQILLDIQEQNNWLSKLSLLWVAERLGVPWPHIYHIATFYKAFSLVPRFLLIASDNLFKLLDGWVTMVIPI
ncbi:NAD(P)H-dependent oxidoreductase subunit E, partial [Chloroflexota bacterium]